MLIVIHLEHVTLHFSHVDIARAFRLACLTREAKVEHFVQPLACESASVELSRHRHSQRIGPASCRVLFVARCAITWTHGSTQRLSAFTHPGTHMDELAEAALLTIQVLGLYLAVAIMHPVSQVVIHGRRIDDLAGVHDVSGIEQSFYLAQRVVQLRPEKSFIVGAPHKSVTMFPTPCTTVLYDELEGFIGDFL